MDLLWEPLEYAGETLVFLGVVGEVLAERKLILQSNDARRHSFEGFASLVLIVGLALSLAALIGTNKYFNGTIANLNNQAAESNKAAGDANKEAAQLRLRAEELEEQIMEQGPRDLLLYGKRDEKFVNAIRPFAGQKVQVRLCFFNSQEARRTGERLSVLLKSAGWNVSPHSPDWGEGNCAFAPKPNVPIVGGLWVGTPSLHPTAETKRRARGLVKFFEQVPLAATLHWVQPSAARTTESRTSVEERYDAPDDIVVVVMPPISARNEPDNPVSHPLGVALP